MSYELKCVNRFSDGRSAPDKETYTRAWVDYINRCETKKRERYE